MLNPPETITGTRIILKKADKTFKQAQISLAEVDASRAELYPWLGWASPSMVADVMSNNRFVIIVEWF